MTMLRANYHRGEVFSPVQGHALQGSSKQLQETILVREPRVGSSQVQRAHPAAVGGMPRRAVPCLKGCALFQQVVSICLPHHNCPWAILLPVLELAPTQLASHGPGAALHSIDVSLGAGGTCKRSMVPPSNVP